MRLALKIGLIAFSAMGALGVVVSGLNPAPVLTADAAPITLGSVLTTRPAGATDLAAADAQALADRDADQVTRSDVRPALDPATAAVARRQKVLDNTSKAIQIRMAQIKAAEQARIKELGYVPGTTDPREIARQMMANKYGWGDGQFQCYDHIIMRESMWRWNADNPHSSAYGIPQALPGSKMASAGSDWRTNPATQITWGLWYVKARYGTPCGAWGFKRAHGWY